MTAVPTAGPARPLDGARALLRRTRLVVGLVVLAATVVYLSRLVDGAVLTSAWRAAAGSPGGLLAALVLYAGAFALRAAAWRAVLPTLGFGQAWAALHVSLLGNHVLPLRLGEALRVTSVLRRTSLPAPPLVASAVARGVAVRGVLAAIYLDHKAGLQAGEVHDERPDRHLTAEMEALRPQGPQPKPEPRSLRRQALAHSAHCLH